MHILLFQHETLNAYRKSPVKTFSVKLAMQCYSPTLNFNNAPTFSFFIYIRICLVCRGNAFDEILHFFGLWNRIFRDRGCEYVSRKPVELYTTSYIGLIRSQHRLIRSSTPLLLFLFCSFRACLSMRFCTLLLQNISRRLLSFLLTCTYVA